MKRGTSIIFLNRAQQVLLALRDDNPNIPYPNCWDILGGHVEENESPEACIKREMLEEIEIKISRPKLFRVYDMPDRIEHTFWQKADFDLTKLKFNEGQELRWFTEGEIKKLPRRKLAFGFRKVLYDFFEEKPFARKS